MFIIAELKDIGGRDTVYRHLLATESVYGGKPFPYFETKEKAEKFINTLNDNSYRKYEAIELVAA